LRDLVGRGSLWSGPQSRLHLVDRDLEDARQIVDDIELLGWWCWILLWSRRGTAGQFLIEPIEGPPSLERPSVLGRRVGQQVPEVIEHGL
jgi:hypothetical protein